MLTPSEMKVLDANSEFYGVPTQTLMDNAGRAIADVVLKRYASARKVVVLCGSGNNGGDGLVAARYMLESGLDVKACLIVKELKTELAKKALYTFLKKAGKVVEFKPETIANADVIIDAMLGMGSSGEPREPYASAIRAVNASKRQVVAVDIPSGLGANNSIKPEITVTFQDVKEGMDRTTCKEIVVVDIGIPKEAAERTGPGEMTLYPIPKRDSHKRDNGTVLVLGGGPYHGAPIFAGLAAYRTGVDLVHLAVPEKIACMVAKSSPSLIIREMPGDKLTEKGIDSLLSSLKGYDSVVVGPGAGRDGETLKTLLRFIKECNVPMVIDADGFSALALEPEVVAGKKCILTPHSGELGTLLKATGIAQTGREGAVELAKRLKVVVLLKGRIDIVTDGTRVKENHFGNPGMTVGGTGDVLSGCCAGLLAKGLDPFDAARLGIYIVTRAGDLAYNEKSYGLMSDDVIEAIPTILIKHLEES
jgi:NAD(P)H-hydrate epimerase